MTARLLGLALLVAASVQVPAVDAQDSGARSTAARVGTLAVPGFNDAVVVAPLGTGARPVIVVLHGMGDDPSSICPAFDFLVRGRAWILCTRGTRFGAGWTYPQDRRTVTAEIHAALSALARREAAHVDATAPVLAGFSLGAMYASFLAAADPTAYPRAFIIDTHYVWSPTALRRFTAHGGRHVAFFCSERYANDCRRNCTATDASMRCRVAMDREHGYDASLFALVHDDFEAIVADDARWT